jgi:hypothetical protein
MSNDADDWASKKTLERAVNVGAGSGKVYLMIFGFARHAGIPW